MGCFLVRLETRPFVLNKLYIHTCMYRFNFYCSISFLLGSFGRFSLALLLTAGKYSRIHFAYSDDIIIDHNFRVPKSYLQEESPAAGIRFFDKIAFIRHLSVVFTVDLFQSNPHAKKDLFRQSSVGGSLLCIHVYIHTVYIYTCLNT